MSEQDMEQPREDDRNDEIDASPVPDPEKSDPGGTRRSSF
jgi:hypothetical protein